MAQKAYRTLTATLDTVVQAANPGYGASVLRVDIENKGASAVTGWKVLGRATADAPMRDITPGSITAADGYLVVSPSPRAANTLAAGANTQLALNITLWDRIEIQFQGVGAEVAASWELMQ